MVVNDVSEVNYKNIKEFISVIENEFINFNGRFEQKFF